MFTLAHLAMLRMSASVTPAVALQSSQVLQESCLKLTQGQHLDISYERRGDLTLDYYWPMVSGKTAALLAACTEIGALAAQADPAKIASYRHFGWSLGLAFQAHDDLLGIWGDSALTGKSADSDLLSGKKSLPVLYGLQKGGQFAQRWAGGSIQPVEIPTLAAILESEGARDFTENHANRLTREALQALDQAAPLPEAGQALRELALILIRRQV
jgi:geranylgeranyl diphosphate synthase type I